MPTATLTSKGQITVPQAVRHALGLHTGTKIDFVPVAGGGFKVVPLRNEAPTLKGRFAGRVRKPVTVEAMDDAIASETSARNGRGKRSPR